MNKLLQITRLALEADDTASLRVACHLPLPAAGQQTVISSAEEVKFGSLIVRFTRGLTCAHHVHLLLQQDTVIAAFLLDTDPEVGHIALVYSTSSSVPVSTAVPQIWLQDMSCQWTFLAASFTDYLRMAAVHLCIRGWQLSYAECGAPPVTRQLMRMLCPGRLLYDAQQRAAEASSCSAAVK